MTYIIAEIGQNHCGSVETAKRLIDVCARPVEDAWSGESLPRVDAVKFTIRDLQNEMTDEAWSKPYESPHSFGATYGAHREALELSPDELADVAGYVQAAGLDLVLTICGPRKVLLGTALGPRYLKLASRDLTNGPLLEAYAESGKPVILSTGMHALATVRWAVAELERFGGRVEGILHCVSEYPTRYKHVDLRRMQLLAGAFPEYVVGYSDHTIGVAVAPAAVAMGAEIIEKHITLDRNAKGSDHAGSLEPDGLWRMVRDIRNVEESVGRPSFYAPTGSDQAREKLERSLCAARDLAPGETIRESDLVLLSPGGGVTWPKRHEVVGRTVRRAIAARSTIRLADLDAVLAYPILRETT